MKKAGMEWGRAASRKAACSSLFSSLERWRPQVPDPSTRLSLKEDAFSSLSGREHRQLRVDTKPVEAAFISLSRSSPSLFPRHPLFSSTRKQRPWLRCRRMDSA